MAKYNLPMKKTFIENAVQQIVAPEQQETKSKKLDKTKMNTFLLKATVHANALLYEMDEAGVDTEEANQLRELLESHIDMAFNQHLLRSKPFVQALENKFDTAIRKTAKEFNIKL